MDEDTYGKCIPNPLEPIEQPICQLWSIQFTRTSEVGSYRELTVTVLTKHEGEVIAYAPFLFSRGALGTATGKEIYGAPKVDCVATYDD